MFARRSIKILFWTSVSLIILALFSLWLMNHKINQAWGAHTKVVDPQLFKQPQNDLAIVNVSVLSENGEYMRPNQTILIEHGLITQITSEAAVPPNVEVIDGTGKFIIPGLIDSHVHLWQSPNDLLLYLANGVTHIREMNGSEEHLQWKAEVKAGRPGPDMFVATRRHNSNGYFSGLFEQWTAKVNPVHDVDAIDVHVQSKIDQGFDAVKIYTLLENDHFRAFNDAALAQDIQLLGHIPIHMKLAEIWQSELKELAHTEELVKALSREFGGFNTETSADFLEFVQYRSTDIAQKLLANDMAVVSTLALMESIVSQKADVASTLKTIELDYVNPGIAESLHPSIRIMGWLPAVNIYRLPEDYPKERIAGNQTYWRAYAQANQILLRAMNQAGVRVLAGTDANVPIMVPGFSLHDELFALTQSGFSEAQALRSATTAPAAWMNIKSGSVQPGYQADLLLMHSNPLINIRNTRTIDAVISNGRLHSRSELDDMLAAIKNSNDSSRK